MAFLRAWLQALLPWWKQAAYLAVFLCGFGLGWKARTPKPVPPLVVGHAAPKPEQDLSPKGKARTVVAPAVVQGAPKPPPVPAPADFGQHLATTTTELPELPTGGTFHAATFATLEGTNLRLRTLEWLDTPEGRAPLGATQTTERITTLALPQAPPPPRWGASLLLAPQQGRPAYGGLLQRSWGPITGTVGHVAGVTFAGVGGRW